MLLFAAQALGLGAAPASDVSAPTAPSWLLVTNVWQMHQVLGQQWRARCSLALTGIVCDASAPRGALVLADATGTEMFAMDLGGQVLNAGQRVALTGDNCELVRRRSEIALHRAPLIDSDGLHPVVEQSNSLTLATGRHPLRVEWFNADGKAVLEAAVAAPGQPRGNLALESGLAFRCFLGNWPFVPDFGSYYPVAKSGVATSVDLKIAPRKDNVALEFSGNFIASGSGKYTFFLKSSQGARLTVGETLPRVDVIGEGKLPLPRPLLIGQVIGEADIYQWSSVAGTVRYAVMRDGRLELELQSPSGNRLQAEIADADGLVPELLLNSQMRLFGVSRNVRIPGGQTIFGLLSVASAAEVQVAEVAPEVATAYPTISIADLTAKIRLTNELEIVHLTGQLQREAGGQFLSLTDGTGKILVARNALGENLAGAEVEAIGNCRRVGTNLVLCGSCIRERTSNGEVAASLPTLTTAEQIMRLKSDEARRGYPVLLRGVVTCTWPGSSHNLILQDATRGIFLAQPPPGVSGLPRIGEFWEAEGVTYAGYFAPMVMANRMTRLGEGRLPVPLQPTWDQLLNGSLDSQFVQIEGLIIDLNLASSQVTLLTHWGKIAVTFDCETPPELGQFQNKLVRIRGCLLPVWDATTHLLKVGEIRLGSATINADQTLPSDPFTAPMKSIGELLRYDIQASMFQRVRISGQFVAERAGEYFLASGGNGARFVPKNPAEFHPGDLVEVAGIPELGGPSPVLARGRRAQDGRGPVAAA